MKSEFQTVQDIPISVEDKRWRSEDDLTSKTDADAQVKLQTEQIEEEVKKAEEQEKK